MEKEEEVCTGEWRFKKNPNNSLNKELSNEKLCATKTEYVHRMLIAIALYYSNEIKI